MPQDPNALSTEVINVSGLAPDNFIASGNRHEVKTQLMQFKYTYDTLKRQGSPLVINAEQFRGTIKLTDRPKVTLYFLQKPEDVRGGYTQSHAEASFRLVDKPSNPGEWVEEWYQILAQRIQEEFVNPIFSFKHGKEIVTYNDSVKGYHLKVWCFNKFEGHRVVEKVLNIQKHSVELQFEAHKVNSDASTKYPDNPETSIIRGQVKRKRRVGAVGIVWFRHAFLTFPAFNEIINLVDTTSSKPNPVLLQSPQVFNYNVGSRPYSKIG